MNNKNSEVGPESDLPRHLSFRDVFFLSKNYEGGIGGKKSQHNGRNHYYDN